MIEGQEGVTWPEWRELASACEEHGLEGLFRSDHYGSLLAERRASLDAWATLAGLAAVTTRIRLGTLVSPITFRHPSELAKAVATVDHISGGRVELGLGAGWNEPEHAAHGFTFPPLEERLERLTEQLEIIHRQWTEDVVDFEGRHYRLERLHALPKPLQRPRPPLIVGGKLKRGTVEPAVRLADEYNTTYASVEECRDGRRTLDGACEQAGREPRSLVFSLMSGCAIARTRAELLARTRRILERSHRPADPEDFLRAYGERSFFGTVEELREKLRALSDVGVERVYLQHLDHRDLESIALIGSL